MKKICVSGLGYIGLPTACLLVNGGYKVIGVDTADDVVEKINRGRLPFEEPGLAELFQQALGSGYLTAGTEPETADVFVIAVPTPLDKDTRMADLSYVQAAARGIAGQIKSGNLVILESTVPPGTCERLLLPILEKSGLKGGQDFYLAHCPERAIPGNTIHEMIHNDRIIGSSDSKSAELARDIYSSFVKGSIYLTNLRTAEMVKLIENTFRDINIALANEFAQIAEESGVNVWEMIELANRHPRVNMLKPGPGVGGHCISIDPWFLAENSGKSRLISLAREINDSMPRHVLSLVKELVSSLTGVNVTVLGVAYKGNVDDTRETPALKFIRLAENEGYNVKIHDPVVGSFQYPLSSLEGAAQDSDCLVLLTDHSGFRQIDPAILSPRMRNKNLVDTRNFLDHERWRQAGFTVSILGNRFHRG